ncbi:retrovirus-related Pol polyprotein from type-1 retrotransposable element R2 [Elysia marginata]|uniref:Retrovirus-related Pol polyprotein from type-1 retrotransposable element R2 n=1 Tax=Elysia marginata TaxID=1093978 RepID=A0AAV4HIF8_9GAST|nr:retrovirus-related Pol polyprotein from type-1 retrotransposable element R2 [Elysia marginata]
MSVLEETRGAQVRAKIKWIEEGEKGNEFFFGLEKSRMKDNTIFRLKRKNGNSASTPQEILEEVSAFYEKLYKEDKPDQHVKDLSGNFFSNLEIPQIKENEKTFCDEELKEDEVLAALKLMKNKSSPGIDGIPTEFYKFFWTKLKPHLLDSYSHSLQSGQLSYSQRRGMITLLHKSKGLSRDDLGNWRPISLTNTDYKILAKALAERLGKVISNIVNIDQSGFLKGRNISSTLREIADIIEYENDQIRNSIVLAIGYQKAFDTVSVNFMLETFKGFGFGENFLKWLAILLKDRSGLVKNGGYLSREFNIERGVRQGCPIAPLIFLLCAEVLALHIRQNQAIKGITLPKSDRCIKIKQFADDTTLFLRDLTDFREAFSQIKLFSDISGLQLNTNKCQALVMGPNKIYGKYIMGIKCVDKAKILGITFSTKQAPQDIEENWKAKIENLERTFSLWSRRDLSIIGKIHIIKTFGLSLFIYIIKA